MEGEGGPPHERAGGRSHALGHAALAELPSWSTSTAGGSPRWSGWRPSTGTPLPCAGYARCGAAGRG